MRLVHWALQCPPEDLAVQERHVVMTSVTVGLCQRELQISPEQNGRGTPRPRTASNLCVDYFLMANLMNLSMGTLMHHHEPFQEANCALKSFVLSSTVISRRWAKKPEPCIAQLWWQRHWTGFGWVGTG